MTKEITFETDLYDKMHIVTKGDNEFISDSIADEYDIICISQMRDNYLFLTVGTEYSAYIYYHDIININYHGKNVKVTGKEMSLLMRGDEYDFGDTIEELFRYVGGNK